MTAKQFLQQAFQVEKRISDLQEEIEHLEAVATNCSPNLTGMPHTQNAVNSRVETLVCRLVDRQQELKRELAVLEAIKTEVDVTISMLQDGDQRRILRKRYMECAAWETIAAETSYSLRSLFRIHQQALKAIEPMIPQK